MSSYIMHMCISQKVKDKLGLTDKFVYGSVLPDIIKSATGDREGTHYIKTIKKDGEIRSLPQVNKAIKNLDIQDKEIRLGYIAHLIEDYIWFNNYIPSYAKKINDEQVLYCYNNTLHTNDEFRDVMYSDYSNSGGYVAKKCNVDIVKLTNNILEQIQGEKEKQILLESVKISSDEDITRNVFMTKDSIAKYIEESTKCVEEKILELLEE